MQFSIIRTGVGIEQIHKRTIHKNKKITCKLAFFHIQPIQQETNFFNRLLNLNFYEIEICCCYWIGQGTL